MKITIQIDAIPQGRPRFFKGVAVDPPKCKQFKQDFALLIKSQYHDEPLSGNVLVTIRIYRKFNKPTNKRYGDIDNLAKAILDACNGILWIDDSLIVDLHISKHITDGKPFVELFIDSVAIF